MHDHWKIVATLLALSLLARGWAPSAILEAEEPDRGPAATRNPLRESHENWPAPAGDHDKSSAADLVHQLQVDLAGSDQARVIVAIHRLRECGTMGATILARLLVQPNPSMEIHFSASNSLEAMGPAGVPPMLQLLESSPDADCTLVWQVLARLGPQASFATPKLIRILRDPAVKSETRSWAVQVLQQIGPEAGSAFVPLLETTEQVEDAELRLACLHAMCAIGDIQQDHQARLVSLLLKEDEESKLRVAAATALANQPAPPQVVLPALIGLAQDPDDWSVCIAAAEALGKFGSEAADAVPVLMKLLDHEGLEVRLAAIAACGEIGSAAAEAVPALMRRIQMDEAASVSESAAAALIKIDPDAVILLLSGLRSDYSTHERTLRALAAIGPTARTAVPQLLAMLADPETSDSHVGILRVLRGIGTDAVSAIPRIGSLLVSTAQPVETRVEAALALGAISPESVPELLAALRDAEPAVRVAAAQSLALQNVRERMAIPALLRELADEDAAEAAMEALVALGADAVPVLRPLVMDEQADLEERGMACLILARIGGDAAPILLWALQQPEEELSSAAELALFELGPRTAVPALLEAIQQHEQAASHRRLSAPSSDPEPLEPIVERMLQLILELSGGMGGPAGSGAFPSRSLAIEEFSAMDEGGAVGSAAPMEDRPAPESPSSSPGTTSSASPAPRMIQPKKGAKARGPAATNSASDQEPTAATLAQVPVLKVIKVFYGTNRQPLFTAALRRQFVWRGFLPALALGAATILVCGIGFARSGSRWHAGLAVAGVVATLWLALSASQQSSDSRRSIAHRSGPVYGGQPNDRLELGMCEVSIPADHQPGELESPSILRLEFDQDPHQHIVLREVTPCPEEQFHAMLQQNLKEKGNNILVFIHGYNVDFDNAARRTAQLACDLEFAGAPLFFSWPSQGNWYEYRQDEKQVELAVPLLKRFLLEVASRSQATSIHLVAHSMGNRALTGALQEMESTAKSNSTHFNQVVLAAPDIDADIFREKIAPAIINQAKRVTLYASSNDLALTASRTFNSGDLRAGDTSRGLVVTPGIETIDVSKVDTSLLGHSYYGDNPTVLTDLKELLNSSRPADQRPFLEPAVAHQLRYWVFHYPEIASQPAAAAIR